MDIERLSDEDLAVKVRSENKELYREIVVRYQGKLFAYVFRFIGNKDDAEDIVQNVFVKAYKNLFEFDAKRKFSSWIYRIAHNESVNYIKRKSIRPMISLEKVHFSIEDEKGNLEDKVEEKLLREKIENHLEELDIKYKEPLILYYLEDKSYQEISDILRKPLSTISTLISRGRKLVVKNFI